MFAALINRTSRTQTQCSRCLLVCFYLLSPCLLDFASMSIFMFLCSLSSPVSWSLFMLVCVLLFLLHSQLLIPHAVLPFSVLLPVFSSILSVWLTDCTSPSIYQPFCLFALFLSAHLPVLSAWRAVFTREVNEVSTTNAAFKHLALSVFSSMKKAKLEIERERENVKDRRRWRRMIQTRGEYLCVGSQSMRAVVCNTQNITHVSLWLSDGYNDTHMLTYMFLQCIVIYLKICEFMRVF